MNITNIAKKEDKEPSKIKVIGVGGGGGNAVNYMHSHELVGVDFLICNTDKQALENSQVPNRLIIGELLTGGRGAGAKPEIGEKAAVESTEVIKDMIGPDTDMVFITAGMGGGTGTGASPIIAKLAKDSDILTVAVVTTPYRFEGPKRAMHAERGIEELRNNVDALIIVSNENLKNHYKSTSTSEGYRIVNEVLLTSVRAIINIIKGNGTVNVDFADVKTTMQNKGLVLMGIGRGKGKDRALDAITQAIYSPLLSNSDIKGSKSMLVNIATHPNNKHTFEELETVMTYIDSAVGHFDADKINGESDDVTIGEDEFVVTVIVTDFDASNEPIKLFPRTEPKKEEAKVEVKVEEVVEPSYVEPEPIDVYGDNVQPLGYNQQTSTQQPLGYNQQTSTQQPGGYNQQTSTQQPGGYNQQIGTQQPGGYNQQIGTQQQVGYNQQIGTQQQVDYNQQIGTQQQGGYNQQIGTQQQVGYNQSPQISAYNTNNNQVSSGGMVLTDNGNVIDAITDSERIRIMLEQRNQANFKDKSTPAFNRNSNSNFQRSNISPYTIEEEGYINQRGNTHLHDKRD